jgi:hypothetical protein
MALQGGWETARGSFVFNHWQRDRGKPTAILQFAFEGMVLLIAQAARRDVARARHLIATNLYGG